MWVDWEGGDGRERHDLEMCCDVCENKHGAKDHR